MRLTFRELVSEFERRYWVALMEECDNCVVKAAQRAGMNRTNAHKILNRIGVNYPKRHSRGNAAWRAFDSTD